MKNVIEIDDMLFVPPPFAAVFNTVKTVPGEMKGDAFATPSQNKPLIQQMVDAKILPPIWNPAVAYKPRGEYVPYAHQIDMMKVYVANTAAYNYADMGCVDDQTEYLSPDGWKKISEYDGGKVAVGLFGYVNGIFSWKGEYDHSVHFEYPENYTNAINRSGWIHFKTPTVDQMLSPEHRIPVHHFEYDCPLEVTRAYDILPSAHQPSRSKGAVRDTFEHARFMSAGELRKMACAGGAKHWFSIVGILTECMTLDRKVKFFVCEPAINCAPVTAENVSTVDVQPNDRKYCFTTSTGVWLMRRNGKIALTGNSMKTSATLWAFDTLRLAGRVDRLLVIAPVSVMTSAWVNDAKKATPHLRCCVLFGSKAKRTKKLNDDLDDVVVINHDGTKVVSDALLAWAKLHKVMVVVDEATAIAKYNTARAKVITQLGKVSARRYVLTATPVAQSLMNAHGYLTFIDNCAYPRSLTAFRQEYFVSDGMHKWVAKVSAFERLQKLMSPAIRINTRDVVDLPPNVVMHRWPAMTSDQQHAYSVMEDTLVYEHDPTTIITAANAAVKLSKLLQVTCGILIGEGKVVSLPPTGKMEELLTIIDEAQSKLMICVPFTAALDYIVNFLADKFSPQSVAFINGSVSASKRPEIVDRFQNPDDPLTFLVVHPKAAGHGLTLTEADTTVWFAPTTSAEAFIQANKRIDRPGQTRHSRTILMSSTELEKKMYESLLTKGDDNSAFVEIYNSVISRQIRG